MKMIAVEEHFAVKDINDHYTKVMSGENAIRSPIERRVDLACAVVKWNMGIDH